MGKEDMVRVAVILPADMLMRVQYWSRKKGVSPSRYLADAIGISVGYDAGDHRRMTQETDRVNHAAEMVEEIAGAVYAAQRAVIPGFDAVVRAVRGDSGYLREFDGDINPIAPK